MMREKSLTIENTRALGARLARIAVPGDVYVLDGDLGSGKTEFARGFVEALSPDAAVRSPTFSIVNIYNTPVFPVYHFDFYRIEERQELISIGIDEYINGDGVCLVEWGTMFPDALPQYTKIIRFSGAKDGSRVIEADFSF
ncbi:MAG: tRNA (adenosine(37)-N6)-threonylcarbamoyltransferase complex ATPase subunit type 1 TsaE [Chitinispirillales bacterium]|jgi:tRNA threonylcarbamoyladenosine biosynthesis protein TsaE|nr:tRNA (adenosine(37)-N6)-threonylcarbamoyltransferase complex ATPase subunit type 1 TsaE [Chitinispirillales bacterium]